MNLEDIIFQSNRDTNIPEVKDHTSFNVSKKNRQMDENKKKIVIKENGQDIL